LLIYALAIPLSFVAAWLACLLYVAVAAIWFYPDGRVERALVPGDGHSAGPPSPNAMVDGGS
jgi:hypothetical protein